MLYVNPANGKLYLWEGDSGCLYKNCQELLEIDPESGVIRKIALPFSAMDLAFDINGLVYLRTTDVVVRYDSATWREVPWDYGDEIASLSGGTMSKGSGVKSGVIMPAHNVVCYMQSSLGVSPLGDLAVACGNRTGTVADGLKTGYSEPITYAKPYAPPLYPGRQSDPVTCCVHVWDKHGKVKHPDAVPGLPQLDGVQMDRQGNLYVMACPGRLLDGQRYFNPVSSTLIKFKPATAKIISTARTCPVPLPAGERPAGPPHMAGSLGGEAWVQNAEWFYGGVGYAMFNVEAGCECWSRARFTLDLYARSFAPEPDLYSFAVLDTNGNLIMHIGQYGNVDDGIPLRIADRGLRNKDSGTGGSTGGPRTPQSEIPNPRSIGGDELGLFCAKFTAVHTDKRLFIADTGNQCFRSVKLGYHAEEKVALKDVPDQKK
jgi:hypothetical protein